MLDRTLKLASLTVARSDFGRMESLYCALHQSSRYQLLLAAGAGHHDDRLGLTLMEVKGSNLKLDCILPNIRGDASAQSATVLIGMSKWLKRCLPDALILMGDRFEMLAAAQAALLNRVPVIHIGGGHLTQGALDERVRHALTKLSAIHLVASKGCYDRVRALHEDPATIHIVGAPEIDALVTIKITPRHEFCKEMGLNAARPFMLVTLHPETNLDAAANARLADIARYALLSVPHQILITAPCADPGNEPFLALCEELPRLRKGVIYVPNLGLSRYVTALHYADLMVGNSSSGIIESATIGLPVVNIGARQNGRDRAENVIDCDFTTEAICNAISAVALPDFIANSRSVVNPYGNGTFVKQTMSLFDSMTWPLSVEKQWMA